MIKYLFTTFLILLSLTSTAQVIVEAENYHEVVSGIYNRKSVNLAKNDERIPVIPPQKTFNDSPNTAFLHVNQDHIFLFKDIGGNGGQEPAGALQENSIVRVDTIFYNRIYKDPKEEWLLTFNVWYSININGEQFYTDYKIHDHIAFKKQFGSNQQFLLVSQSTGYDDYYDSGYPNHFFAAVLDSSGKLIFSSDILDFDYVDEFWDESYVHTSEEGNILTFTITGFKVNYTGRWDGKDLSP